MSHHIIATVEKFVWLERVDGALMGYCPFRKSHGARLIVQPERDRVLCLVCGDAYSAQDFARALTEHIRSRMHRLREGTCTGTTKAGAPCRRPMVYPNSRCRAHGGATTEEALQVEIERLRQASCERMLRLRRWRIRDGEYQKHSGRRIP